MATGKDQLKAILDQLPDECSLEDIQYHLYVVQKIHLGIARAGKEGTVDQDEVEKQLRWWASK